MINQEKSRSTKHCWKSIASLGSEHNLRENYIIFLIKQMNIKPKK